MRHKLQKASSTLLVSWCCLKRLISADTTCLGKPLHFGFPKQVVSALIKRFKQHHETNNDIDETTSSTSSAIQLSSQLRVQITSTPFQT